MIKIKTYCRSGLYYASITSDEGTWRMGGFSTKDLAIAWVRTKVNALDLPIAWCATLNRFVTIPQD